VSIWFGHYEMSFCDLLKWLYPGGKVRVFLQALEPTRWRKWWGFSLGNALLDTHEPSQFSERQVSRVAFCKTPFPANARKVRHNEGIKMAAQYYSLLACFAAHVCTLGNRCVTLGDHPAMPSGAIKAAAIPPQKHNFPE